MDKKSAVSSNTLPEMGNKIPHMEQDKSKPRDSLARNVKFLMDLHGHSGNKVSQLSKGKVSPKTVNNMINTRNSVTLDKVEAVAEVYGLTSWHLIMPNLPEDLIASPTVGKLYENYIRATKEGRSLIDMITDREASHSNGSG